MLIRPTRTVAALAVLLGLLAALLVLRSSASAQDPAPRTLTLRETERGGTFAHIRNTKGASQRSNLAGDVIVFTNPVVDAAGKRIGKTSVSCVTTTGSRNFTKSATTCHGVTELPDGSLMMQAIVAPDARTTNGAVTGGTGAYANARGVFTNRAGRSGSQTTITLVD
jgi:allene oxide cyclase-like protein